MDFRDFLEKIEKKEISAVVSKKLEAAGILYAMQAQPVFFKKIKESDFRVAGNVYSTKPLVAQAMGIKPDEFIPAMVNAIENPSAPNEVSKAPCQEVSMDIDLNKLPILFHVPQDGGNYISSGVVIAKDSELGHNVSFHRMMQLDKKRFSTRILQRHTQEFINRAGGELDAVMCVGCSGQVLLGGATSVELGKDELQIANTLSPYGVVKAKTSEILIPADTEFVLEGRFINETTDEGKFVDLTGTYDIVRQQQIFEVKKITHRKDAIWHALLPGGLEHKIMMGMPKEPTIFREVNKSVKCLDVNINPGGCSWLHAIVQIDKKNPDDGKKAIEAAFAGHKSLKHAFIVDKDINIYDPLDVEWAMATRFQGDKCLVIKTGEKGSSLDPSADPNTRATTKVGFDLTIPGDKKKEDFLRAVFPKVDLGKYL